MTRNNFFKKVKNWIVAGRDGVVKGLKKTDLC